MTSKIIGDRDDFAEEPEKDAPPQAPQVVENVPSTANRISGLASANAPVLYFDSVPFCGHTHGVGELTLTAGRCIAPAPKGTAYRDHVVTALLRAPLPALRDLRAAIDNIEKMAEQQLADAVHAATGGSPPSGSVN